MNWLDLVFIGIFLAGSYLGLKIGMVHAVFTALGILVGAALASQLSDDVGAWFAEFISNDAIVDVIAYALIIVASIVVAGIAGNIVRKIFSLFPLGFVDRLGGVALGSAAGVVIAGVAILGMAKLTYSFDVPEKGLVGDLIERTSPVVEVKGKLDSALTESTLVPMFMDVIDTLPANALGFVPSDFRVAIDILGERIEQEGREPSA